MEKTDSNTQPNRTIPRYLASDVLRVTGITNTTLQSWLARGYFDVPAEATAPGSGGRRLFHARLILQIAFTRELVKLGLGVEAASEIGWRCLIKPSDTTDDSLEDWVKNGPSGSELYVLFGVKSEDGSYSRYFHLEAVTLTGKDFSGINKTAIVFGVGAIAKQVLDALDNPE